MNEKPTPTTLNSVEMFAMERNARTHYFHVAGAVVPQWLARTVWDAMLGFQGNLLLKQEILQLRVRREFEAEGTNDLLEEVLQRPLP